MDVIKYVIGVKKMENERLLCKEHVAAFVDLLGASEAIKNDTHDTNLNTVNYLIHTAKDMLSAYGTHNSNQVHVKAFSDNIVFAIETENLVKEKKQQAIHDLCLILSIFQMRAFSFGVLLRGAITVGKLYIDDTFVWGKALLKGYKLESKTAIYPRIVVDESVLKWLPYQFTNSEKRHHVKTDFDGVNFIDILSFLERESIDNYIDEATKNIDQISKLLETDKPALQKLRWYESYIKSYIIE